MPQIENSDDLRFIANHPFFCVPKGFEGWLLRANLRNWLFARNLRPHCRFGEGNRAEHFSDFWRFCSTF